MLSKDCALGELGDKDSNLGCTTKSECVGATFCLRTTLRCSHVFGRGRDMGKLFICAVHRTGRSGPCVADLRLSLPGHGVNFTKHVTCGCSCHCVLRLGFNCGNSRHFTGGGH